MSQPENVNVVVTVGDVKVQFNGSAESVMASVNNFLSKQIPSMELARNISLNYSTQELTQTFSHLIKITPVGPRIISDSGTRLSDKDLVALQLIAARIARDLGKIQDDAMQVAEI